MDSLEKLSSDSELTKPTKDLSSTQNTTAYKTQKAIDNVSDFGWAH